MLLKTKQTTTKQKNTRKQYDTNCLQDTNKTVRQVLPVQIYLTHPENANDTRNSPNSKT